MQETGVREGSGVQETGVGERGGDHAVRDHRSSDRMAGAYVQAGLVRHGSGGHGDSRGGVRYHGSGHGVGVHGSGDGVRNNCGGVDHVHAGLVGHSGRSDGVCVAEVTQGTFLQVVSVSGVTKGRVSQDRSGGVCEHRGGVCEHGSGVGDHWSSDSVAGAHVNTGLVRHGSSGAGVGDHGGGGDGVSDGGSDGVSDGNGSDSNGSDGNTVSGDTVGVVWLQSLSLVVQGASVDHLRGVQGAAVRVQHHSGMVCWLRHV